MKFVDLGLTEELLSAVTDAGYETPTPIQAQAIPQVLMGRDILGCAQTGTGKTASFTLPMIDILAQGRARARMPRSLILAPTRELAAQVADNFTKYGKNHKLSMALLIGGTSMQEQMKVIDRGVDVLIATPGRLLDVFDRGGLILRDVKILVIDEADRMMDMGFIPDVEKIVSTLPQLRQTLFFSATMAPPIRKLADKFLMNPKEISVAKPATTADTLRQGLLEVNCKQHDGKAKRKALRALIKSEDVKNAIIFCNRKRDVSIVQKSLAKHGYNVGQMHGDMVQSARMETLEKFKNDEIVFLVCSDVAARGIDIPNLSHVFNFDLPSHAEDYVHRIGRTGRAGKKGTALSIATLSDKKYLAAIVQLIGGKIPTIKLDAPLVKDKPKTDRPKREEKREEKRPVQNEARPARDEKPTPKRGRQNNRKRGDDAQVQTQVEPTNGPIIGMGAHTPAFLLRPIDLGALDKADIPEKETKPKTKAKSAVKAKKPTRRRAPAKKKVIPIEEVSTDEPTASVEKTTEIKAPIATVETVKEVVVSDVAETSVTAEPVEVSEVQEVEKKKPVKARAKAKPKAKTPRKRRAPAKKKVEAVETKEVTAEPQENSDKAETN